MRTSHLFSLFLFVGLALCIDPSRVILVDKIGQNYLFRTSTPVSGNEYQMDVLQQIIAQKLAAIGDTYPSNPNMHAYSLISLIDSIKEKFVENKYFEKNHQYEYSYHPIIGSLENPQKFPKFIRKMLASTYPLWNYDKLNVLTELLYSDLAKQESEPKIIYFHCVAGEDRTGQVYGGYVMRYLNQTYQQALDFDNQVESRTIHKESEHGMNWFCYWLNIQENKGGDCSYVYPSS